MLVKQALLTIFSASYLCSECLETSCATGCVTSLWQKKIVQWVDYMSIEIQGDIYIFLSSKIFYK